jgi:cytochrome c-type biogenesis protein CcmH/NrfG
VPKDVALELRQLVQRGFDHHEHGRVHDALSDWETALKLQPRNVQVKRLVDFGKQRVTASTRHPRDGTPSNRPYRNSWLRSPSASRTR